MASAKVVRKVALVGASGTVGTPILAALLAAGHQATVLTRPGSKTDYPSTVTVQVGAYDDEDLIAGYLAGHDVLILAMAFTGKQAQIPLIKAAARAGVAYIVPCEFGSDPTHPKMNAEIQYMNMKKPFRDLIESLGVSKWIGVVTNPWVEFGFRVGLYGIDLKNKTAAVYDAGDVKANVTTLRRVGDTIAAVLALPEAELAAGYANEFLFCSSFYVSQRDLLASAVRATGTSEDKDWTVTSVSSDKVIEDSRALDPMAPSMALLALVFKEGHGGDYNDRVVDYARLGLQAEDLDAVVKGLAQEIV